LGSLWGPSGGSGPATLLWPRQPEQCRESRLQTGNRLPRKLKKKNHKISNLVNHGRKKNVSR
jgi:hypothetical protein